LFLLEDDDTRAFFQCTARFHYKLYMAAPIVGNSMTIVTS
jgi:hypothetical protein